MVREISKFGPGKAKVLKGKMLENSGTEPKPHDDISALESWILGIFVCIALALRLFFFQFRCMVEGDGAIYASLARNFLLGDLSAAANCYWSRLFPPVIAIFSLFTKDVVLAGRLVSAIFGAFILVPVFLPSVP